MAIHLRRKVTKWGNGYGIRLTKVEAKELGVREGDTIEADVAAEPPVNDVSRLPAWNLGPPRDIDEILEEEAEADARR